LSKAGEIEAAFARIREEIGETDVLLYNAAMRPYGRLMETKPSTFENTWRVGAFGAFLCSQAVVPGMLARKAGVILFTGATAGIKPFPTSAAFGPAKFALRGLAQVMARDPGAPGNSRGVHKCRRSDRHAGNPSDAPPHRAGRHARAVGDRRDLLAPRASASQRMDAGVGRAPVLRRSSECGVPSETFSLIK
jgi:hypothetical protein